MGRQRRATMVVSRRLAGGIVALAASLPLLAPAEAQDDRYVRPPANMTVSAVPQATTPGAPPWSGEAGSSGSALMTPEAILAAAANFKACLEGLWPAAAKR